MNLVGEADNWYYGLQLKQGTLSWLNFVEALYQRFEDKSVSGIFAQFQKVYQTGTVQEYHVRFQSLKTLMLMSRPHLDEGYFVENFIEGLKEELKPWFSYLNPKP